MLVQEHCQRFFCINIEVFYKQIVQHKEGFVIAIGFKRVGNVFIESHFYFEKAIQILYVHTTDESRRVVYWFHIRQSDALARLNEF